MGVENGTDEIHSFGKSELVTIPSIQLVHLQIRSSNLTETSLRHRSFCKLECSYESSMQENSTVGCIPESFIDGQPRMSSNALLKVSPLSEQVDV